jgi:hypothetical protein
MVQHEEWLNKRFQAENTKKKPLGRIKGGKIKKR